MDVCIYQYLEHFGFVIVKKHLDRFFDWNHRNTEMKTRQEEYCRNIFFKGHVCALKTFWSARFLFSAVLLRVESC